MMPNGPKYGPDSVQNAAGDTARETIRKLDPSGFICRPPPPLTGLRPDPPPHTPLGGELNGNPHLAASGKRWKRMYLMILDILACWYVDILTFLYFDILAF